MFSFSSTRFGAWLFGWCIFAEYCNASPHLSSRCASIFARKTPSNTSTARRRSTMRRPSSSTSRFFTGPSLANAAAVRLWLGGGGGFSELSEDPVEFWNFIWEILKFRVILCIDNSIYFKPCRHDDERFDIWMQFNLRRHIVMIADLRESTATSICQLIDLNISICPSGRNWPDLLGIKSTRNRCSKCTQH